LLNILPQAYNLTGVDLTEFNYYSELKNLQANLIAQGRNIFQLDPEEKAFLDNIAQNSLGLAGIQAQNILEFAYNYEYTGCAALPDEPIKSSKTIRTKPSKSILEPSISAFPNPSKEWCAIKYSFPIGESTAVIQINDFKGHLFKTYNINHSHGQVVWDVRDISAGLYYISLKTDQFVKTGKLIVIH
jgi:hypothetical protein